MVKGRMPRETNPVPGEIPGFVSNFDTTGNEDYERVSPHNPYPVGNYIKQGSLWVPVSKENPVPTQLTGRNIEEVYFFNAIAISTTDIIPSDTIDLSKYKKITILALNSLNQEVGLFLEYRSANAGFLHVWENGSWKSR